MNRERFAKAGEILTQLFEIPLSDRPAFLDVACGDDATLRKEVQELLLWHERGDTFLETPALNLEAAQLHESATGSLAGRRIGQYEALSFLSAGGMGEVYRARDERLDRHVAIKVLRADFASD